MLLWFKNVVALDHPVGLILFTFHHPSFLKTGFHKLWSRFRSRLRPSENQNRSRKRSHKLDGMSR